MESTEVLLPGVGVPNEFTAASGHEVGIVARGDGEFAGLRIALTAVSAVVLYSVVAALRGDPLADIALRGVALAFAAVPEGLPAVPWSGPGARVRSRRPVLGEPLGAGGGRGCRRGGRGAVVRGVVGLAAWVRVPAGIVGATVAAFATSSPELSVGVQSAMAGTPVIALGDALGSNVINIACVLGIVLVTGPLVVERREVRRELSFAAVAPVLTLLALVDGKLVPLEAMVLLGVFTAWLVLVTSAGRKARLEAVEELGAGRPWAALASSVAGLALLVLAGRLIVVAAKGIGADLGLDPFVVGATLVAIGTSTPELATTIISRRRGHLEIGLGTLLGSNVFNNLWIVGVAALIHPISADVSEVLLAIVACLVALTLVTPSERTSMGKTRGVLLLAVAAVYMLGTVLLGA